MPGGGKQSTLTLKPNGLSDIDFDLSVADLDTVGYTVNLGSLRLREEDREKVEYAGRVNAEGGAVLGYVSTLVVVSFDVVIRASSKATLIQRAHALRAALKAGGWLLYKPESLPAGVTGSYYYYLPSSPGALLAAPGNRWDVAPNSEGYLSLQYQVELTTFPFLVSDPDSPVTVVSATTIYNHDDAGTGHDNWVTIPAASLKGDARALLQITLENLETGSYDDIVGVYIFPRTYGLTNYKIAHEPGTAVVGDTEWSTVVDANRSGGSYVRLTPASDDVVYRRQFAVSNWTDFVGRHLLLLACRDNGATEGEFEVRGGWSLGSGAVLDPTRWKSVRAEWLGEWVLFSLGELEFPGTQLVEGEETSTTPYYEIEVRRTSGAGTFDVDVLYAAPVDLRPMYVDCSGVSFLSGSMLLVSNLEYPIQVAHVVDATTLALVGPAKPRGLWPLAEPGLEATSGYRLYFLWERREGSLVVDEDFSGYDANWQEIDDCEAASLWGNATDNSDRVEGTYSKYTNASGNPNYNFVGTRSYAAWTDDDYFCAAFKASGASDQAQLRTTSSRYFYAALSNISTWYLKIVKKGDFSKAGAPDPIWSSIDDFLVSVSGTRPYFDNWRWSKKDPDAVQPNDFGSSWNYRPSGYPWFVFTDAATRCAGNPIPVGSAGAGGSTEQTLLSNMSDARNVKVKLRCYVFASSVVTSGKVGLLARCSDQTSGSEDGYALVLDSAADTLTLYKYVAGTPTALATVGFTVNTATWYWLGIECYENTITCYAHATEGNLWDAPLIQVTDTTQTTGKCGLIVTSGMGRFDDFEVWAESDRYNPSDTAEVEVKALLRGVNPHYE